MITWEWERPVGSLDLTDARFKQKINLLQTDEIKQKHMSIHCPAGFDRAMPQSIIAGKDLVSTISNESPLVLETGGTFEGLSDETSK